METHPNQDGKQGEKLKYNQWARVFGQKLFASPGFQWGTAWWPWGLWSWWQKDQRRWREWKEARPIPRKEAETRQVGFSITKGPFPQLYWEKHLRHKELLKLKDKDVEPVKDVGGEFCEHKEEKVEVDRDRPLQTVLVHLAARILIRIYLWKYSYQMLVWTGTVAKRLNPHMLG